MTRLSGHDVLLANDVDALDRHRAHSALPRDALAELTGDFQIAKAVLTDYRWKTHCRGLFQSLLLREC